MKKEKLTSVFKHSGGKFRYHMDSGANRNKNYILKAICTGSASILSWFLLSKMIKTVSNDAISACFSAKL